MQMLMVRYWATHGSPVVLATLPGGSKGRPRGQDTIRIDNKDVKLDRFTVEGLIWGRETLWFDTNRNLIAAVSTDAEFDHSRRYARDMRARWEISWDARARMEWRRWRNWRKGFLGAGQRSWHLWAGR